MVLVCVAVLRKHYNSPPAQLHMYGNGPGVRLESTPAADKSPHFAVQRRTESRRRAVFSDMCSGATWAERLEIRRVGCQMAPQKGALLRLD